MKLNMERKSRPVIAIYLMLIALLALTPIVGLAEDPTPAPAEVPTETAVPIDTVAPLATETETPAPVATDTPAPPVLDTETAIPTEPLPGDSGETPAPTAVVTATLPSVTYDAEADAFVSDDASSVDTNYGSDTSLEVAQNPQREGLIRFTVKDLRGGIVSAKLRLHVTGNSPKGPVIYGVDAPWDEATVTWNTRPQRAENGVDQADTQPNGDIVEYDVTKLVGGNGTFTFNLVPQSSDGLTFVFARIA